MGDFTQRLIDESKRIGHDLTGGLFKKPKTPPKTSQELELEARQRKELNEITREKNERLKALKRSRLGRKTLLGSGSELGIDPDNPAIRAGPSNAARTRLGRPGSRAGAARRVRSGILSSGRRGRR